MAPPKHFDEAKPWSDASQPLELVRMTMEAPDVATFVFKTTEDGWFRYMPGQFVTLEVPVPNGPVLRTYTLSSSPSRPASIAVTAKAQGNSVATRWMIDHLKVGDRLKAFGPAGRFSFHLHPAEKYLFVSAGSGITPMMSMARWVEDHGQATDIGFVNCARRPGDIIFRHELERMSARSPHFHLAFVVEAKDPHDIWTGYRGRLSGPMLALIAPDFLERTVFCCGPEPFMAGVRAMLTAAGFDLANYHEESFHPPEDAPPIAPDIVGEAEVFFTLSEVEARAEEGETILQVARGAGLNIPTGCTMGLCGTCKVHKASGETVMQHNGGIRDEDIAAGYILACCTRPVGRVEIEV